MGKVALELQDTWSERCHDLHEGKRKSIISIFAPFKKWHNVKAGALILLFSFKVTYCSMTLAGCSSPLGIGEVVFKEGMLAPRV